MGCHYPPVFESVRVCRTCRPGGTRCQRATATRRELACRCPAWCGAESGIRRPRHPRRRGVPGKVRQSGTLRRRGVSVMVAPRKQQLLKGIAIPPEFPNRVYTEGPHNHSAPLTEFVTGIAYLPACRLCRCHGKGTIPVSMEQPTALGRKDYRADFPAFRHRESPCEKQ